MKHFETDPVQWVINAFLQKVFRDTFPNLSVPNLFRYLLRFLAFFGYLFCMLILLVLLLTNHEKNPQKALQQAFACLFLFVGITMMYHLFTTRLKAKTIAKA